MEVGKRIVELRQMRGLTTNKLANMCGLSQSFIRSVELGDKRITVENLELVCDALHTSLRDFFDVPEQATGDTGTQLIHLIHALSATQQAALLRLLREFN